MTSSLTQIRSYFLLAIIILGFVCVRMSLKAYIPTTLNHSLAQFELPVQEIGTSTVQLETGTTGNAGLVGSSSLLGSTSTEAETKTVLSQGDELVLTRSDLTDRGGVQMESRAVITLEDLKTFAQSELYSDKALESLRFTRNSVELRYRQSGKLLALVSVPMTIKAKISADEDIKINFPWYSLISVDHASEIETEMRIAVQNALHAHSVGTVRGVGESDDPQFTASEAADVAEQAHGVLRSFIVEAELED